MATITPVLTAHWDEADSFTYAGFTRHKGYQASRKALTTMQPDDVIQTVKDSGLRGRGGAGFPTGMKWGFIPQGDNKPHYFVVNADESEPGTCKDIPLMMANPHVLVEGIIIGSYAIRSNHAFIYIRGEVPHVLRRVQAAVAEAYANGELGKNIHGSGYDLELTVHAGAGAYICGEETALLDSLEGYRGQPRLRPPFPAVAGLYACPTVVNNVESVASVPSIIANGIEWFGKFGTEKSKGFTLYSLSGHVKNPGQIEAPLGITLRELLDLAGGMREGSTLKFWTTRASLKRVRCWARRRCKSLTKPRRSFVVSCVGLSFTSTSPVASALHVAKAHGGCSRSWSASNRARALKKTLRSCLTCATTSWVDLFAHLETEQRARSPRPLSTSVTSSSPVRTRLHGSCSPMRPPHCSQGQTHDHDCRRFI
jgi:hypothetical protein